MWQHGVCSRGLALSYVELLIDAPRLRGSLTLWAGGEPFTAEEFDEFITASMDPDRKTVAYDEHAELMALEDEYY